MALSALAAEARERFAARYGREPAWIVAAPGRVNVIGEHVDYNDGLVLPMAIERHVVMAAASVDAPAGLSVCSSHLKAEARIRPGPPDPGGDWSSYIRGVTTLFACAGIATPSLDVMIHSDLPAGAGLSSSAALEVATATLLETVSGTSLEPEQKIGLCREAEQRWAGVPCGIMDQTVVTLARRDHLMLLDCRDGTMEHVPFGADDVAFLLADSGVRHALGSSPYAERRRQCEAAARQFGRSLRDVAAAEIALGGDTDPVVMRRAHHVVTEIERTRRCALALAASDWEEAGRLMTESHRSLKEDFDVSCAELDALVDLAVGIGPGGGVFGSRLTGGGFGGCTVSLVRTESIPSIVDGIGESYRRRTGRTAEFLACRPAEGARRLEKAGV